MTERSSWTGSAADLLRAGADRSGGGISRDSTGWPKNPRALAGRLRRAQTFLRVLGIVITFSRAPEAGLSGCVHSRIYRPHRQHRPRPWAPRQGTRHRHRPQTSARTTVVPIWWASGPSRRSPSQRPTMLTVLTQTPPFGETPPPIAVATYASARQKLCRAPLDDELARNRWIRRMEGSANRPTLRM